jgi:ATP-dependent Clp protease adapter protein ClpS
VEQVPDAVLEFVITVACEALLHSTPDGGPMRTSDSEAMAEDEIFIACLFNDDVHDMDMVKSALVSATACSQSRASELMMAAHHNGHTEVMIGERAACHACQEKLRQSGLSACLTSSHWIVREQQACVIVSLLRSICAVSNGLRRQICAILLKKGAECGLVVAGGERDSWQMGCSSWCSQLLSAEEDLWCGALIPLHELYIQVIADEESKNDFADLFVRFYPRMMQHLATTTVDGTITAIDLSVQIFTVPTVVQRLVRENHLLPLMTRPLVKHLYDARTAGTLFDHGGHSPNHEQQQQRNLSYKLFPRVLHDISYILRIPNVASGLVRKPLSSWRGDWKSLTSFQTSSTLEDAGIVIPDIRRGGEAGGPGGGGGGEGGYMSADSDLAKAVVEVVLGGAGVGEVEFLEGIEEWLMLCRATQCMNAHKRIPDGEHIHFEDHSWQFAFQLAKDLIDAQVCF